MMTSKAVDTTQPEHPPPMVKALRIINLCSAILVTRSPRQIYVRDEYFLYFSSLLWAIPTLFL